MREEKYYICDDCGHENAFSSYVKARATGWAVSKDYKYCYCPNCAPDHRKGKATEKNDMQIDELLKITPDEKAAGASATRRVKVTPIEDEMLYAFRKLGKKHDEKTQRGIINMIEKML